MTESRLLARNAVWSLAAQGIPIVLAIVAVPLLIHGLGAARFGVLALAWTAIGYFSLFDLGLGRALTQAVSVALGRQDEEHLASIGATALTIMFGMGLAGGVVIGGLTPSLVQSVLKIPVELRQESMTAFFLLAASLPFVVMTAGFRGLLEAHQHFGAAVALRVPYALFSFLGPVAVLPWSRSLVPIVGVLVAGRVVLWAGHAIVCIRRYPYLRKRAVGNAGAIFSLLRTGGWMTVSNIISPLMVVCDRFLVGAIISMTAVTYYVTPFEMVTRLLLVPAAVVGVLFPAFARSFAETPGRTTRLLDGGIRTIVILMFPPTVLFVAMAQEILTWWVGSVYAEPSAGVLRWLAIGVFLNSIGQVAFGALQAIGRPDLTAKVHAVELPLYLGAILTLARIYGVEGVAMAWTLRIAFDTIVLLHLTYRRLPDSGTSMLRGAAIIVALIGCIGLVAVPTSTSTRLALCAGVIAVFSHFAWRFGLQPPEREVILSLIRRPPPAEKMAQ